MTQLIQPVNWNTITGKPSIVNTVNGAAGAVSAVSSLNGQTGAVDTTTLGNIGSIVVAECSAFDNNNIFGSQIGATVAGSTLYKAGGGGNETFVFTYQTSGNVISLGLSGTWRLMMNLQNISSAGASNYMRGIFVRVS